MLGLYLCDSLKKSQTFVHEIDTEVLRSIKAGPLQLKYFRPMLDAFDEKGDTTEVREALAALIRINSSPTIMQRVFGQFRYWIRTIDTKYNQNRLYWYMAHKGIA
jgi:thioredoxin-related protein